MLDVLFAGAAAALFGVVGGHGLSNRGHRNLQLQVASLERSVCDLAERQKDLVRHQVLEEELQKVRVNGTEIVIRAVDRAIKDLETGQLRDLEQRCLERSDALQGQLLDVMQERLAQATGDLISRDEVANAFAQVAAIEAQKLRDQQADAARTAAQQQRIAEVFGTTAPMTRNLDQQLAGLNDQLNGQLAGLQQRLAELRGGSAIPGGLLN